jgi:Sap, sulfolipid-1-addressing protein
MIPVLGQLTPLALTVAFTTLPIVATLAAILGSGKASRGWLLTGGYAVGIAIVLAVATYGTLRFVIPSNAGLWLVVLLAGIALLVLCAIRILRRRRDPAHPSNHSAVIARLERLSPGGALLIGLQFALHPENLVLIAAASTSIVHSDIGFADRVLAIAFFCAVSVSTVALPSAAYSASGAKVRPALERLRDGLLNHSRVITTVLIGAVGVALIAIGIFHLATAGG